MLTVRRPVAGAGAGVVVGVADVADAVVGDVVTTDGAGLTGAADTAGVAGVAGPAGCEEQLATRPESAQRPAAAAYRNRRKPRGDMA